MPGDNVLPFYQPDAFPIQRAQFTTKHLWVTKYDPDEMFAAGDYPNQHSGAPVCRSSSRATANWRTRTWSSGTPWVRITQCAQRVAGDAREVHRVSPPAHGFFDGNPALDVAPSPPGAPRSPQRALEGKEMATSSSHGVCQSDILTRRRGGAAKKHPLDA